MGPNFPECAQARQTHLDVGVGLRVAVVDSEMEVHVADAVQESLGVAELVWGRVIFGVPVAVWVWDWESEAEGDEEAVPTSVGDGEEERDGLAVLVWVEENVWLKRQNQMGTRNHH